MSPTIQTTLDRARATGSREFVDKTGLFSPAETEALRRVLRAEKLNGNRAICGEWRKGYELMLDGERLGVTNGYGRFRVYYRNRNPKGQTHVIPFMGEPCPVSDEADDYAIQPYN